MDKALLGIVVLAGGAILTAVAAWLVSCYRERKLVQEATEWPSTEATVEAGTLESPRETNKIVFPTFTFSYKVSGHFFSGRFCLIPRRGRFTRRTVLESIVEGMKGRKLFIRYDPERPEVSFVPDKSIDDCKVGQKVALHLIHAYYPADQRPSPDGSAFLKLGL